MRLGFDLKQFSYVFTLVFCASFSSCGPKEFNLSAPVTEINLADVEVVDTVVVNGSDGTCQIAHVPDWIEATVVDSVVTLKTQANTGTDNRVDSLVITCGVSKLTIPVVQGHKATKLEIPKNTKLTFSKEGGEQSVDVDTDGSVIVEAFDGVTALFSNGKLTVKAGANTSDDPVKGTIKLMAGDFSAEIPVVINGNICPTCHGSGKIKCRKCKGEGSIYSGFGSGFGLGASLEVGCTACGGAGSSKEMYFRSGSGKQTCPDCKGAGK